MGTEPLKGTRPVRVTAPRTAGDWAQEIRDRREVRSPEAARRRLGCENLNPPGLGSLSEVFPPAQARRLAARWELHPPPKHGRWLHSAAIALRGLTRHCLARRLPDRETLPQETPQWEQRRNASQKGVDWPCSTLEARIKLKRLYPQIQS